MSVIWRQLKDIFTSGEGTYMNEHGEEVHGKLPRQKLENPFKVIMRPTAMSEFVISFPNSEEEVCKIIIIH